MPDETLRRLGRLLGTETVAVYGERVRLRQDDLLIRSRASAALARAATVLRDLAARYRAERIPPATREQPFPPAEAMRGLQAIEQLERSVQEVEVQVRSAPLPPEDAVWERLRSARLQLDTVVLMDIALIEQSEAVEALAASLSLDGAAGAAAAAQTLGDALSNVRATLRKRTDLLSAPA